MDNICIFNDWKLSSLKFAGEGTKRRAELALTTRKPNAAGVWNKNFFTAFGKKMEALEKLQLRKGAIITVTATQQAYIDKDGVMRNNYLIQDFEIVTYGNEENNAAPVTSATQPRQEVQKPANPETDIMDGLNRMMEYME